MRRTISLRLLLSLAAMGLVSLTAVGLGWVAERNLRRTLTDEIHSRLVLEAANLANLGSDALLDDFPELLLMPVIQQSLRDRPELAFITVVDHEGKIQGDADTRRLNEPFRMPDGVAAAPGRQPGPIVMSEGPDLIVATAEIRHGDEALGRAHVGLRRSHLDQAVAESRRSLLLIAAALLLVAAVLAGVFMHAVLRPVASLREGLERIGRGDLDTPMQLRDRTELGLLAETVNDMAGRIRDSQQQLIEKERLDHEMELARRIQASLMPDASVRAGRYFGTGLFESAAEVGGDYFDVFELPGDRLGVFMADVAGKGLGGCLVTSMLAALVRTHRETMRSPRDLLSRLDSDLAGFLEPGVFVTALCGVLETGTGRFTFASAAHCPLLLARGSIGEVEAYRTEGVPLGILPHPVVDQSLADQTVLLSPGDLALLYTDGLTEAPRSRDQEQFGEQRVREILCREAGGGARHLLESLRDTVTRWEGSRTHADDLTLLLVGCDRSSAPAKQAPAADAADGGAAKIRQRRLIEISSERELADATAGAPHFAMGREPVQVADLSAWIAPTGCADAELAVQVLYEYLSNVQEHGFLPVHRGGADVWCLPAKSGDGRTSRLLVRDRGRACPPDSVPSPDLDDPRVRTRGRGLGWELIRQIAGEVEYVVVPSVGNLCLFTLNNPVPAEEDLHV